MIQRRSADNAIGWVPQPDRRGTLDIIWSCTSTIFICIWVMLHLNVPAEHDTGRTIFFRKLRWFILAILAPELLMLFAAGQWASAKRSVKDMAELRAGEWTMVHAFYADSGGFMLQASDSNPFPVTARQIYYLIEKGHLEPPSISKKEIWDKSKADAFAKMIAGL